MVTAGKKVRALYVDDEPMLLDAMARSIGQIVDLDTCDDPVEAMSRIRTHSYAIVISDLRMPEHDGIEVLRVARQTDTECLRFLVSARADFDTALAAINEIGVYRFFTKPWSLQQLRDAVDSAARLWRLRSENERLQRALAERNNELLELNTHLDRQVTERTASALQGLIGALDLRDTETQSHSRRVALYARLLASRVGLDAAATVEIERGALLHDIGKIGVTDAILRKPGKLTDEEWVEMRKHPEHGSRILAKVSFLGEARLLVEQHHEQWNGTGYPRGIRNTDICIGARIFGIIDAYDAITSDRPYRKANTHEAAATEIRRCAGEQFDPALVESFSAIAGAELDDIRKRCEIDADEGLC